VRFVRFNSIGVVGFLVQIVVLTGLLHAGVHYLAATALAVECAILHNFFWHERWTWKDRPSAGRGRLGRLLRFHALNGTVSLAGNVLLMRLFVGSFGLPAIPANLLAVIACALVNYVASDRIVFSRAQTPSAMSSCESDVA
jgi:putative flippase GtrA